MSPRIALLASLTFALTGCVLGEIGAVIHPTISGELLVQAPDGSQTRWTPDRCVSGDIGYFAGFDFVSSRDAQRLRAALDPIGGAVLRWQPTGSTAIVLRRADCQLLDLQAQPTGWRVNQVREFAGYLALECRSSDGTRLQGRLSVDHCH